MTGRRGRAGKQVVAELRARPRREQHIPAVMTPLVEVFISGALDNPLNGSHGHWSTAARRAKHWRTKTALVLRSAFWALAMSDPTRPKQIHFVVQTWATWDDDNLAAGCKPLRDGLKDAGVIDDDTPGSGHQFLYTQRIDRKQRGIHIVVRELGL